MAPHGKVGMLVELPLGVVNELLSARKRRAEDETHALDTKKKLQRKMPPTTTDEEQLERCIIHHLAIQDCTLERLLVSKGVSTNLFLKQKGSDSKTVLKNYLRDRKVWQFSATDKIYRLNPNSYLDRVYIEEYPEYTPADRNRVANAALTKCLNLRKDRVRQIKERYVPYADEHLGDPDQIGTRTGNTTPARLSSFMAGVSTSSVTIASGSDITLPPAPPVHQDGLSLPSMNLTLALPDKRRTFTLTPVPVQGSRFVLRHGRGETVPIVASLSPTADLETALKAEAAATLTPYAVQTSPRALAAATSGSASKAPAGASATPSAKPETTAAASRRRKPDEQFNPAFRHIYTKPQLVGFVAKEGLLTRAKANAMAKKDLLQLLHEKSTDSAGADVDEKAKPTQAEAPAHIAAPQQPASSTQPLSSSDLSAMEQELDSDLPVEKFDHAAWVRACERYEFVREKVYLPNQSEMEEQMRTCNKALQRADDVAVAQWYTDNLEVTKQKLDDLRALSNKLCRRRQQLDSIARLHACGLRAEATR